jgi:chromosome segregation ATPase
MLSLIAFRRHLAWIAAAILVLVVLIGGYRLSTYLRTSQRLVGDQLRASIPQDFELERCRTMIHDLDNAIQGHRQRLVALQVDRQSLAEETEGLDEQRARQADSLRELQVLLAQARDRYRLRGQEVEAATLRREAAQQADRLEHLQGLISTKRLALTAIDDTLAEAEQHIASAQRNRDEYQLRLEQLNANAEQVAIRSELQLAQGRMPGIDQTMLQEVDSTFARLERELNIQQRQLDLNRPTTLPRESLDPQELDQRLSRLLDPAPSVR